MAECRRTNEGFEPQNAHLTFIDLIVDTIRFWFPLSYRFSDNKQQLGSDMIMIQIRILHFFNVLMDVENFFKYFCDEFYINFYSSLHKTMEI